MNCTFILLIILLCIVSVLAVPKTYCHPNPCLNEGTCSEAQNGYDCHCAIQYTGANCEGRNVKRKNRRGDKEGVREETEE